MAAKITIPTKEALLDAMKVAGNSIEAAKYLEERVTAILRAAGLQDQCAALIHKIKEFANLVSLKLSSASQVWSGQAPKGTDYKNMHENLGTQAVKELDQALKGNLQYNYAINAQGQIRRQFSVDGKTPDASELQKLDVLFNAWLASKANAVSSNSTLYEAAEDGSIKLDAQGKAIIADVNKVNELITDPKDGFAKYMQDKGINTTIVKQEYPAAKSEEKLRKEIVEEINEASEEAPRTQTGM